MTEDNTTRFKATHYDHGNGVAVADVDGDPDLFATSVRTGNVLFENDGKGRFTDITAAGVAYEGHSSGAVFFDYDNNGRVNLYLTDMHSDMSPARCSRSRSRRARIERTSPYWAVSISSTISISPLIATPVTTWRRPEGQSTSTSSTDSPSASPK